MGSARCKCEAGHAATALEQLRGSASWVADGKPNEMACGAGTCVDADADVDVGRHRRLCAGVQVPDLEGDHNTGRVDSRLTRAKSDSAALASNDGTTSAVIAAAATGRELRRANSVP